MIVRFKIHCNEQFFGSHTCIFIAASTLLFCIPKRYMPKGVTVVSWQVAVIELLMSLDSFDGRTDMKFGCLSKER